ncbi:MAG: tetratricopeptide repeat protein [bacterium]
MAKGKTALEAQEHYSYGKVFFERGEPERAVDEFKTALDMEPDNANVLIGLGQCYLTLQKIDGAVDALEKAVQHTPEFADAHYFLGRAYMEMGLREKATNEFKEALNINPRYMAAKKNLSALMKTANQKARRQESENNGVSPDDEQFSRQANIHFHMGNALFQKNMLQEALVEYKEASRLRPNYPDIRNRLGELYMRRGQYHFASEELQMSLKINPKYVTALINLAECHRLHSEQLMDKAEKEYQRVLELDPDNSKAARGLEIIRSIKNIDFI